MGSMQDHSDRIETARRAFRIEYRNGDSTLYPGADRETYDIDVSYFDPTLIRIPTKPDQKISDGVAWHGGQIQVHGDRNLRDVIVAWLQNDQTAYAVNVPGGGGLDVRTVGPTRRSAIVNWLHLNGIPMLATTTDEEIEYLWRFAREKADHKPYCIRVGVHASQQPGSDVSEKSNG